MVCVCVGVGGWWKEGKAAERGGEGRRSACWYGSWGVGVA